MPPKQKNYSEMVKNNIAANKPTVAHCKKNETLKQSHESTQAIYCRYKNDTSKTLPDNDEVEIDFAKLSIHSTPNKHDNTKKNDDDNDTNKTLPDNDEVEIDFAKLSIHSTPNKYDNTKKNNNDGSDNDDGDDDDGNLNKKTVDTDEIDSIDDFEDMSFLSPELFAGIHKYGFKYPSSIQAKTIHIMNKGTDLIAQSQSGTGKTGAFTIGGLSRINPKLNCPQFIILAHTRTLACQIAKVVENLSVDMHIKCCLCIGGILNTKDNAGQAINAHVLVCTPGRLCDLINRKTFNGEHIKTLVIDEADELMKSDFRVQFRQIVDYMGTNTQMCIFSATFTKEALQITEEFLVNPYRITIEKEKLSLDKIQQYKVDVNYENNKFATLEDLLKQLTFSQMIIFVNKTKAAITLRNKLMESDLEIEAGLIYGKMDDVDRESILKEFRLANTKILITTDVMCRGIDVDDLRIVMNYDMVQDEEVYIHRIGRSGRYGSQGIAINFCTFDDAIKIRKMERIYKIKIVDLPPPKKINEILTGIINPVGKVLSSKMYE